MINEFIDISSVNYIVVFGTFVKEGFPISILLIYFNFLMAKKYRIHLLRLTKEFKRMEFGFQKAYGFLLWWLLHHDWSFNKGFC